LIASNWIFGNYLFASRYLHGSHEDTIANADGRMMLSVAVDTMQENIVKK